MVLAADRAHHGLGHQGRRFWGRAQPRTAVADAQGPGAGVARFSRSQRLSSVGFQRLPVPPGWPQTDRDHAAGAWARARALRTFVGSAARLRQHVVGDGPVRPRPGAQSRRARPTSLGGIRPGLFRLFRRGRFVMVFGSGALLLAYLTVQRAAELWWAKENEARLMASGGIEYGHSHLPLMILF